MKPARFHPEAETELASAVAFYDRERSNLGTEFAEAVEQAVTFIRGNPAAGMPTRKVLRRWLVRRFPFTLVYRDEAERVYILAVAHHRRRPGYWNHRT